MLAQGIKFIPKPERIDKVELQKTLDHFSRRIKLAYFFYNMKEKQQKNNRLKIPSTWIPPEHLINKRILETLSEIKQKIGRVNLQNSKSTKAKKQIKILNRLRKDHNVIFKPADKGSSLVIQNRQDYISEAQKQLSVALHYKKLDSPIFPDVRQKIEKNLKILKSKKYITNKEYKFLKPPEEPRPRKLYLLPKIHKELNKWTNSKIPPGRPIVSDCSSDTYNLAAYLDHFLTPLSTLHPAYVKDTPDFLDKIRNIKIDKQAYLITLDVESLYTNIDNKDGLEAVREILKQHPDPDRPDKEFLEFLEICLNSNDFQFNQEWFLQIWGTSMGKKFAPAYANIFMAHFEKQALAKCSKLPECYFRFLDDIFTIWTRTLQDFDAFLETLNSHHPTIKLKATVSLNTIDFLDVTIFKGPHFEKTGHLDTKVYFKPTDTHELLHHLSYHPKHTFKGLLKSQILRFRKICTNNSDFDSACSILFKALSKRHYSKRFMRSIKSKTIRELQYVDQNIGVSISCNNKRCAICPNYLKTTSYIKDHKGISHRLKQNLTCTSENIIYCIECNSCGSQYVGQTKNTLRERISQHKSNIKTKKDKPLANHFHHCPLRKYHINKPNFVDFKVCILEQIPKDSDPHVNLRNLLDRESYWMRELDTLGIFGINSSREAPPPIPLIIKYSDNTPQITRIFKEGYNDLRKIFPNIYRAKIVTAHSRNKNIRDMLISTDLKQDKI